MMKKDRYDISDLIEAQFKPSSDNQVLKNRLGVKSKEEMDELETEKLEGGFSYFYLT